MLCDEGNRRKEGKEAVDERGRGTGDVSHKLVVIYFQTTDVTSGTYKSYILSTCSAIVILRVSDILVWRL